MKPGKTLLVIVTFLLFIFAINSLMSCTKVRDLQSTDKHEIEYTIPVYEQESVTHYNVEISTDGKVFSTAGMILASDKGVDTYTIKIDATRFFTDNDVIYTRIKSIDIDNQNHRYSATSIVRLFK